MHRALFDRRCQVCRTTTPALVWIELLSAAPVLGMWHDGLPIWFCGDLCLVRWFRGAME